MAIGSRPIFVTSGTPTFSPKTLSRLIAWYRSDLGITLSGSNVSAWKDQSGTGDANKNLTTDTALNYTNAPYQATFARFNNLPALGQVATNNTIPAWKLVGGGNFTTTSPNLTPITFYAVFSFENLAAIGSIDTCWFPNANAATPNLTIGFTSPGSLDIRSNNPSLAQATPITEDVAHIICATWFPTASNPPSSSTWTIYIDDYTNLHVNSVVASGPITSLSNIFIGSNSTDGDPFLSAVGKFCDKFALAELIIYDDNHSGATKLTKRKQIMQYLGTRYNLDVEVPTITSITPNAGSGAGGDSITIVGHGFTRYPLAAVSSVTLDSIDATSITVVDNTTITALSGVGSAGTGNVIVAYNTTFAPATGPTSITLSNGWTYTSTPILDPTTLSLSGFWRANYTGAPWNGTASAGASSGRNMVTNGVDLTTGSAVNGFTPATNNKNKGLKNTGTALSSFVSGTAGSGWALIKPVAGGTSFGLIFSDAGAADAAIGLLLLHDSQINNTAELIVGYGAGNANPQSITAPTGSIISGTWNLIQWTFNATSVRIKINGGAFTTDTFGSDTLSDAAQHCDLGDSSGTGDGWDGDILEVAVSNTVLSDTVFNNVLLYCNDQYGLFLDGPRSVLGTRLKCEFTGELGSYVGGTGICTDLIGGGLIGNDTVGNRPTLSTTPGGHAVWDFSASTSTGLMAAYGSEFQIDPLAAFPAPGTGQRLFYCIFNAGSSFPVGADAVLFGTGNEGAAISSGNGKFYIDTNLGGFFSAFSDNSVCDNAWHRLIVHVDEAAPLTTVYIDGVAQAATMNKLMYETTEIGGFNPYFGNAGGAAAIHGKAGRFGWAYTGSTFSGTELTNLDAALLNIITG